MRLAIVLFVFFAFCASDGRSEESEPLTAPQLTNNPTLDVIATNKRPLLSFFNSSGGNGKRNYTIQIDKVPSFDSSALIEYKGVPEGDKYVTTKLVDEKDALTDNTRYYWRVRAQDSDGKVGPWAKSRFFLDTKSDDSFMNLTRIAVSGIEVSSGQNPKNIVDLDDPGQATFWQATPPGEQTQWVKFDLGEKRTVSRIWILSNPQGLDGWLKDFAWQSSDDGNRWENIQGAEIRDNDTYRNIIDFKPVATRYLRLLITDWHGYAPQINVVTIYSPGKPPIPKIPQGDYVLIVGNQQDGFTFTELARFVKEIHLGLETVTVPHYEVSLEMVNSLAKKPVAIILSGNNADYQNLPMFEYNGEFELIRECDIPILGICCGHQMTVMAYGYTYAHSMGWEDITSLEDLKKVRPISIKKDDPIFAGIPNPFVAPEIHGWAVDVLPADYEVLAASTYIQSLKSNKKMLYGEQFHAEIKVPYNQGTPYLVNFLKMAIEKRRSKR